MPAVDSRFWTRPIVTEAFVVLAAALVAVAGAMPAAQSANDGGRLAAVESLVDRRTFAIDDSVFVAVPAPDDPSGRRSPYDRDLNIPVGGGTVDKLFIDGHFYSDKSPVPTLLIAIFYQLLQWLTGIRAAFQPTAFCYAMNLFSAGLPYVVAVWAVHRLGRRMELPTASQLLLTASFGLATLAPVYARSSNGHIVQLGAVAPLVLGLTMLSEEGWRSPRWGLLAGLGCLTGLGYAADLGAGPPLLACVLALVAWRTRSVTQVGVFLAAAFPWVALHHGVTYAIGHTFRPLGAVPEYLAWEGSPFNAANMTGTWKHDGVGAFLQYAFGMLFGKFGFVGHNLPLFLALVAMVGLLRRRTRQLPELIALGCWCGAAWLSYGLLSNNYSGASASIRWFVPLLAPAYCILAVALRRIPSCRRDLLILSVFGAPMMILTWRRGPWHFGSSPGYLVILPAALACWIGYRLWSSRRTRADRQAKSPLSSPARAA